MWLQYLLSKYNPLSFSYLSMIDRVTNVLHPLKWPSCEQNDATCIPPERAEVPEGLENCWRRSMAMGLLSCLLSLQVGVTEVQALDWGSTNPSSRTPHVIEQTSDRTTKNKLFELAESGEGSSMCEETYGFLPCSTSVGGNLFLMLSYGYLLFTAAKFISDGSELLLEVPSLLAIFICNGTRSVWNVK